MKHQCEAILCTLVDASHYPNQGHQCAEYNTEQMGGSGRWLCWVHRVSFLKPEPRRHAPMQFVPQKAPR